MNLGHAEFDNKLWVEGTLVVETALHIGMPGGLGPAEVENPVAKDYLGRPYIPGSSFKGVLRTTAERLLSRQQEQSRPWACLITDENGWCVTSGDMDKIRGEVKGDREITRRLLEKLCTACLLFGSPWFASKVKVKDLFPLEWHGFLETRTGVAIDRDTETAARGKLFEIEVVPPGTQFRLEMVVENATPEELGFLFLGLREFESGSAFLGMGTSRGLGRVKMEIASLATVTRDTFPQFLRSRKPAPVADIQGFIDARVNSFISKLGGRSAQTVDQ